jgi:hypothetical protein
MICRINEPNDTNSSREAANDLQSYDFWVYNYNANVVVG